MIDRKCFSPHYYFEYVVRTPIEDAVELHPDRIRFAPPAYSKMTSFHTKLFPCNETSLTYYLQLYTCTNLVRWIDQMHI